MALEGQVEDEAGAYGLDGIVVAVGAHGIEAAVAELHETEVHVGQEGDVDARIAHVLEVVAKDDVVADEGVVGRGDPSPVVENAVVGACDACRCLKVRADGNEARVEDGADAAESGVESSAGAVVVGIRATLGAGEGATQIRTKFYGAELQEVVVDPAGSPEGANTVVL